MQIDHPIDNLSFDTLKTLFDASRSPLIVTDNQREDNPIIYSNQAFLDLTGYDMTDIIGHNCRFLQGEDSDSQTVAQLRDGVKNCEYVRVTLKNYRKDGTPFWNDLVMSPIKDSKGVTTHFMGMQLDITERIDAELALEQKSNDLEASNHELEQFTYATSHDLQEPLRMVNSYVQLLKNRYDDKLDDDAKVFLDYAAEGADRMQQLINDLLTLSRVSNESDRFKTINMSVPVGRAVSNLKMSIEESNATITVEKLPSANVDPVQITQLFQNLISNALKYQQPGAQPVITITARKEGTSYIYSVTDNGIGIPQNHFERIFVIFQRLHTRSEYPGTGVGLAICKKIVDRHGGQIWVESAEGSGSTFSFTLSNGRE
jgi:PAS domain S-box-containing protein